MNPGVGHLPFFFGPTAGNLNGLLVPTVGNLPCFKKNANARSLARGGGGGRGGMGTAGIDSSIIFD